MSTDNAAEEQKLMARIVAVIMAAWKEEKKPAAIAKAINVASRLDGMGVLKRPGNPHRELLKKVLLHTEAPALDAFSAEECAELNALMKEAVGEVPKVPKHTIITTTVGVDPALLDKIKKH